MKITEWRVEEASSPISLSNAVTRSLQDGWELYGELQVVSPRSSHAITPDLHYVQVMVKRSRTATDVAVDKYKEGIQANSNGEHPVDELIRILDRDPTPERRRIIIQRMREIAAGE